MRVTLLLVLLVTAPCGAQDLPDPGRRLSQEELNADPEKPRPAAKDARTTPRTHDAQACENARRYYQMACRVPESRASRSMQCAEAYAIYRQACP